MRHINKKFGAVITASAIILIVALSGCTDRQGDRDRSILTVTGMDISVDNVRPATVDLSITAYVENTGSSESKNATLIIKAIDKDTDFLEAQVTGQVDPLQEEEVANVTEKLTLPKSGGYNLIAELYEGKIKVGGGSRGIYNLDLLPVDVQVVGAKVDGLEFMVRGAENDSLLIQTDVRLTNLGDNTSHDADLIVRAIEMESGLTADKKTTRTGEIEPGTMVVRSVDLKVPDQYNYVVEAAIWRNGTIVSRGENRLLLEPECQTLNKTERIEETDRIQTSEFVQEEVEYEPSEAAEAESGEGSGMPGFGAGLAMLSIALLAIGRRIRR